MSQNITTVSASLNQRDGFIDFVKGLLMIGVIWGHAITALSQDNFETGVWIHQFFRIYDMPFFMVISGFFLKVGLRKYSGINLLVNRIGMILIPIIFWTLLRFTLDYNNFYFLWAVLVSSFICIVSNFISKKTITYLEPIISMVFIIILHIVHIPWNLFYLFPFFCVGYYLTDLKFKLSTTNFVLVLMFFIIGQCFGTTVYSPWILGFDAWKEDLAVCFIYLYRFVLSLLGIFLMANVFHMFHNTFCPKITDFIISIGRETLALYILQSFVIEWILKKIVKYFDSAIGRLYSYDLTISQSLIGYLFAPLVAFCTIFVLLYVIRFVKSNKYSKWVFGFKIINK